jgi:hypothetical protein
MILIVMSEKTIFRPQDNYVTRLIQKSHGTDLNIQIFLAVRAGLPHK